MTPFAFFPLSKLVYFKITEFCTDIDIYFQTARLSFPTDVVSWLLVARYCQWRHIFDVAEVWNGYNVRIVWWSLAGKEQRKMHQVQFLDFLDVTKKFTRCSTPHCIKNKMSLISFANRTGGTTFVTLASEYVVMGVGGWLFCECVSNDKVWMMIEVILLIIWWMWYNEGKKKGVAGAGEGGGRGETGVGLVKGLRWNCLSWNNSVVLFHSRVWNISISLTWKLRAPLNVAFPIPVVSL